METSRESEVKLLTKGMSWMLLVASMLVFLVGIQLFILTEYTAEFFSWPITPPRNVYLTAAFLGAGYWASFALELFSSRQKYWANARLAVPSVLIFTTLTLILTIIHRKIFSFAAPFPTNIFAWVWTFVYAIVPPVMGILLVLQLRKPGKDPLRNTRLPFWLRGTLLIQGIGMLFVGIPFFVIPGSVTELWPWLLGDATGRSVGAWMIGFGIAAIQAVWENDWERVHLSMMGYMIFAILEFIALARYWGDMNWDKRMPSAIIYVVYLASVLIVGIYGTITGRRIVKQRLYALKPEASV